MKLNVGDWFFLYSSEYYFMLGQVSKITKKTVYYHRLHWDKRGKKLTFDVSTYVTPVSEEEKRVTNKQLRTMMKAVWSCNEFVSIGLL